jgi:5-formyltetrahydrofolate cyclo-ligase
MSDKVSLRRTGLARRARMTAADREDAERAIVGALREQVLAAQRVAAYASVGTEPATAALLALRADVVLPVLLPDGDLDWATGRLVPGPRGLLEPAGPRLGVDAVAGCDLVLVPALAVDAAGVRLGRGGGSYDRALRRATGRAVALLYDGELVDRLPAEAHDVPVDAVVTPSGGVQPLGRGDLAAVLRQQEGEVVPEPTADGSA